jgi:uncharacterized protein YbaR (Trm112 family)
VILEQELLGILVCPVDKGWLLYFADEDLLYNPRLRRAYRIEKGIPVMLAERAEPIPEREHERLLARARHGAAEMTAAGLPDPYPATAYPATAYPATASGGNAGPAADGRSTPA